jgi:hypothetical protein
MTPKTTTPPGRPAHWAGRAAGYCWEEKPGRGYHCTLSAGHSGKHYHCYSRTEW